MRHRIIGFMIIAAASTAFAGCGNKEQEKAQADQAAAAQKAAEAQREADQKIAAAKVEAEQAASKAQADRATAKDGVQKSVDAADRKITYLKEKAAKLAGTKKADGERAMKETDARRETLRTDMRKLDTAVGADWDAAKAAVDKDVTALNAGIDSFETTVTGKPAH